MQRRCKNRSCHSSGQARCRYATVPSATARSR
ncbi:CxxxxCH/CxxCH domain-containing protein [Halopseudomonas nanhaiensis]|nr:CxxxxCH/CxxCH domain-containing protein [Halopseudomonas nanhaiensis]